MNNETGKLIFGYDFLRAFATVAVVVLHVSAPILLAPYRSISSFDWWVGNIVDGSVRFCVPVFLMLTGALVLPKHYELTDFLKRRFSRILLPFLFWSLIYILYDLFINRLLGENLTPAAILRFVGIQFRDGASFHLWYIYTLIGIYLLLPILSKWVRNCTRRELLYFLLVWFGLVLLDLPFVRTLTPKIDFRYFSGYVGFPVLGYYSTLIKDTKRVRQMAGALLVGGTLVSIAGSYVLTSRSGVFHRGIFAYLSPNVIVTAIGVFLLFRNVSFRESLWTKTIRFVSKYSYGIYLSHILVLTLLTENHICWPWLHPLVGLPLTAFLCVLLSALLTFVIGKLPFGSKISG